jgi:hypothetical protein
MGARRVAVAGMPAGEVQATVGRVADPAAATPEEDGTDKVGVKRMLAELAFPAGTWRREFGALEERFIEALDPLLALFVSVRETANAEQDFPVRQLIARAMSDLIVAVHLITHGYFNQAYGTFRTAYEALDLAELLSADAEQAKLWVNTDKGHADFKPSAVRERLGKDKHDPVYSALSELSHPRFAASKLTSFGKQKEGSDDLTVIVRVGPFLLDGNADPWIAAAFLVPLVGMVSVRLNQLVDAGAVTEDAYFDAVRESQAGVLAMGRFVGEKLDALGLDARQFVADLEAAPEVPS